MQRQEEVLRLGEHQRLVHLAETLGLVEFVGGCVDQAVDFAAPPGPPVEHAGGLGLAVDDLQQDRVGVDGGLVGPSEGRDVERACNALLRDLRARADRHVHLDADFRPHGGSGLADLFLVDIAVRGADQRDSEAARVAGGGEELFRAFDIERQARLLGIGVAGDDGIDEGAGVAGVAAHDGFADGFDIDGHVERLADTDVPQRVRAAVLQLFREVERVEHGAQFAGGKDLQARGPLETADGLERHGVGVVDLLAHQAGEAGGIGRDGAEFDARDVVLRLVPPVRVDVHDGFLVGLA